MILTGTDPEARKGESCFRLPEGNTGPLASKGQAPPKWQALAQALAVVGTCHTRKTTGHSWAEQRLNREQQDLLGESIELGCSCPLEPPRAEKKGQSILKEWSVTQTRVSEGQGGQVSRMEGSSRNHAASNQVPA